MVANGSEDGTRPAEAGRVPSGSSLPGADTAVADGAPLLRLRGISKNFGPVQALAGVDLDIPVGQVTALVGDNGAGKSHTDQDRRGHLGAKQRRDPVERQAGSHPLAEGRDQSRDRDRLPGPGAV